MGGHKNYCRSPTKTRDKKSPVLRQKWGNEWPQYRNVDAQLVIHSTKRLLKSNNPKNKLLQVKTKQVCTIVPF